MTVRPTPEVVVTVSRDYVTGRRRALVLTQHGAVAASEHDSATACLSWATQWLAGREPDALPRAVQSGADVTDPTDLGSTYAGPGGPHDRDAVVVDATNAVLLDAVDVLVVGDPSRPRPIIALQLAGWINKRPDRAQVMFLFDEDGAAAIISELLALAGRVGPEFRNRLVARTGALVRDGLADPGPRQ